MDYEITEADLSDVQSLPGDSAEQEAAEAETDGTASGQQPAPATETPEADAETTGTEDTAGEDAEAETSDKDEKDEEPAPKPKRKSGLERLREQNAALRAELAEERSRQKGDSAEPAGDAIESRIGRPPREEDFDGDFLKFERAMTVYEMRKANAEDQIRAEARSATARREAERQARAEAFNDNVEELVERIPDLRKVLNAPPPVSPAGHVRDLVLQSDAPAHLVYALAKNPELAQSLNAMSPTQAAREIGKLEAKLSLPAEKKPTKAPPPVKPAKGTAPKTPSADDELDRWLKRTYGGR